MLAGPSFQDNTDMGRSELMKKHAFVIAPRKGGEMYQNNIMCKDNSVLYNNSRGISFYNQNLEAYLISTFYLTFFNRNY